MIKYLINKISFDLYLWRKSKFIGRRPVLMVIRTFLLFSLFSLIAYTTNSQSTDSLSVTTDSISSSTIDTSDYYPGDISFNLIVAASKGYDEEVLRLLNKGAEIDAETTEGVTALMYAVQNGYENVVKILLLNGADPDLKPYNGPPALIVAISNNNAAITEMLIRRGADINLQDHDGRNALMHATAYGNVQIVDMLIYYEAHINSGDNSGVTALMIAGYYGFTDIAKLLIANKATLEKADLNGFTALHYATQNNHKEMIELLVSQGVNIEKKNLAGYSPLSVAVSNNNKYLAEYFIQEGANVNSKISSAYKPLNLAKKNKNDTIVNLLEAKNAKSAFLPSMDYGSINFDFSLSGHDFLFGGGIGLHDTKYGLSMNLGFVSRILATEILEDADDNLYYQYWERRSYLYLSLIERLPVYSWAKDHWIGFGLGGQVLYTWGSYRGSVEKPDNKFMLSPQLAAYARIKHVVLSFKYEYVNFKVEGLSPHRFIFGLHFLIPGKRIREPIYKEIIY